MARTDLRSLSREDVAFFGLGALILVASFLPWYGTSYSLTAAGIHVGSSTTTTAWHRWTALGILLMLLATLIVAIELFSDEQLPELKIPWKFAVLGLDAAGALLIIVKSLDQSSVHMPHIDAGLRWGAWVLMIAAIAQVVVAALRLRASGEPMSWASSSAPPGDEPPAE